ncbi:MAG: alpha/beta hydrolase [Candidatus Omnitrophica bacterium]|nr:alpha/beta hydrolase [Candidatus Omnitrophota bacterium]MCM8776775.1 alpha/beta hydrolase [Candidatus Omnitrophota bacterium]
MVNRNGRNIILKKRRQTVESRYFFSVDMNIHYQTEGKGPLFICLHGGKGNSGDYFIPYLSPLADEATMVYLDERGSGKSKPVPDKNLVSYRGMSQDIDNLIHCSGEEKASILGHSFGAALAIYFTLNYPHRVKELYLVCGGVTYPEISRSGWYGKIYNEEMERLNVAEKVKEICDRYNRGEITGDESFRQQVMEQAPAIIYHWHEKRDEVCEVFSRTDFTYLDEKNSNFRYEAEIHNEIIKRMEEIRCPVLLVAGQQDISFPLEAFGLMARKIPKSEMCVIPRSRHFPFIDEPEIFVQEIRNFRKNKYL